MTEPRSVPSTPDSRRKSGEQRTVPFEDGRIVYAEYGSPDGRPVLLFHGTPGSRRVGRLFESHARAQDVRLLVPDRPGYGRSTPRSDRTLADTGTFVEAVLESAGVSRADVVGFSGGGPHALALAATHEHLVGEVDVVSATPPPTLSPSRSQMHRVLGTLATTAPTVLRGLFRIQAWAAARRPPSFVLSGFTTAEEQTAISDEAAELLKQDFLEALSSTHGFVTETALFGQEWGFSLAEIDRPVRLWHGDADETVPVEGARAMADAIPDARLEVDADGGHVTTLLRRCDRLLDRS
ncbi:alpha/beta fold hydrolase [Natronobacterium texcoconense]|uniref:Pimeloyl-ACP methyl ester carboxylesterase n=1 Tax=Natronobacterium texcoconense TaxID=1095778 RepID=A0A1H1CEB0_NATTX|nr:alpha/beta hydrolase [Natronobacterium texcoconense]SDQ61986.1 Pimeloyl-ACP methyl ester carboxylesterase [Natronobacterium texcoconense]